jgi:hypothetical protein
MRDLGSVGIARKSRFHGFSNDYVAKFLDRAFNSI